MLALLGHDLARRSRARGRARSLDPARQRLSTCPHALPEIDVLAELRELRTSQPRDDDDDRPRLLRHAHAAGRAAQGAREPGLVHGLHAVPAGDLAGSPGGAAQLTRRWSADLTGLPLANASLLDEATAAAEAMTVARRASKAESNRFVVDADVFPQTLGVLRDARRADRHRDRRRRPRRAACPRAGASASLAQYPGASGRVRDLTPLIEAAHARGRARLRRAPTCSRSSCSRRRARWAPTSSSARRSASASRSASAARTPAYMSVREGLERTLPGRLVGALGRRRRQPRAAARAADPRAAHPPREGDLQHLHGAGAAGRDGVDVRRLPRPRWPRADRAAHPPADRDPRSRAARRRARRSCTTHFFDTIRVRVPDHADAVIAAARQLGINLLRVDADTVGISCDEVTERPQVEAALGSVPRQGRRRASSTPRHRTPFPPRSCAHVGLPHAPGVQRASLGDRRCCATCARSRAATSRSTAR